MTDIPSPLAFDPTPWENLLAETARRHHVPGIVAGVLRIDPETGGEQRFTAATGVSSTRTGVPSTRDTLCQVGSITKVVTATMILQLREEGRLDLDTPVTDILERLELGGVDASTITVEHLLTHTSGIDGDLFTDTGRGDDCVEKYVATLSTAESLFAPDTGWSYCNSGFVLAGRIIEVLDGRTWDESLQARISARLDLERFVTLPEEVMAHHFQLGHVRQPGQREWNPARTVHIPRSMGPAGLITSSVDDLLDFGAAFLRGGAGPGGTRLLHEESVELMTRPHVTLPQAATGMTPQWGLGWMLDDWNGHRVYWHGGTTVGNNAWFQVLPDDGLVLVVFCNGGVAPMAAPEVFGAFARTFAGTEPTRMSAPAGTARDAVLDTSLLGRYADASTSLEVRRSEQGSLEVLLRAGALDDAADPEILELLPADGEARFVTRSDDLSPWTTLAFTEVDGRACAYVGIRCLPLREDAGAGSENGADRGSDNGNASDVETTTVEPR